MSAIVLTDSLGDLAKFFEQMPDTATQAAVLAINDVASGPGLALLKEDVLEQVNFPREYLNKERLGVSKRANRTNPEAIISGRDRPTSLARFAPGQTPATSRNRGVRVEVHKGNAKFMRTAFLVKLKNGNTGLAIRLKPGERVSNKKEVKASAFGKGLYLLYGPSVDQVLRSVMDDQSPEIASLVSSEFLRQFTRLSRGQ